MHKARLTKLATAAFLVGTVATVGASAYAAPKNYKAEYKDAVVVATPAGLKDGPYVGLGVGYDSYKFRQNISFADDDGDIFTANPALSAKGWMGSIFAGYGQYFNNNLYLAGEVHYDQSGADTSYTVNGGPTQNYNANVKARGSWGIDAIPGVKLTNSTLLYAKVGYISTNFKASETAVAAGDPTNTYSSSRSIWRGGVKYGVGIETLVNENVSVRGEYTHSNYGSFSNNLSKYSPANDQFVLAAVYHFVV